MKPPDQSTSDGNWIISNAPKIDHIGPYKIIGSPIKGGMGDVYRVWDEKLGRHLALKLINAPLFSTAEIRAKQEISILKSLNHDNIVRLLDEGVSEAGQSYYVMEFIEGLSLDELVGKMKGRDCRTVADFLSLLPNTDDALFLSGPLGHLLPSAPAQFAAIRIAQQVAAALDYLHRKAIIHRDLKPSNILIKANGRAILIDFGIARVSKQSDQTDLTGPDDFLGTHRYAAPEQHRCEPVGVPADIYGLGAVLYELVCGRRLFDENYNRNQLIAAAQDETPPSPFHVTDGQVQKPLSDVIIKALSKHPERRFSSMMEFAQALQNVIEPTPSFMEEQNGRAKRILRVFTVIGLSATVGSLITSFYKDYIAAIQLPHPLLSSLIFLAIGSSLGAVLALGWLVSSLICDFFSRWRSKRKKQ